jgi:hypothetical protein
MLDRVKNTGYEADPHDVIYRYLKGLRAYKRSALVQLNVLTYLSLVNDRDKFPADFALLVESLQRLDQSENPVGTSQSNSNRFAVSITDRVKESNNEASKGNKFTFPNGDKGQKNPDNTFQVFTVKGLSKKFKKDTQEYSGLFKPSHVGGKRKFENNKHSNSSDGKNPKTKELVKKLLAKDPSKSESDIYKTIQCRIPECGKFGHIASDCSLRKGSGGSTPKQVRTVALTSETEVRNTSGFFSVSMTNCHSKPMTEEEIYNQELYALKNKEMVNLDSHANIHVWNNKDALRNVRKVKPISVEGLGGYIKKLDTVGDHPLLGEVFIDEKNKYNLISIDLMREDHGYFRRISKDNKTEWLYNEDLKSLLTFKRDPVDGFIKMPITELNEEVKRIFPNLCMSVS